MNALIRSPSEDNAEHLRVLADEHPGWDEPLVLLGQALRSQGDWTGAVASYRRALSRNPHRVEALTALGAYLALVEPSEARVLLARACAEPGATWEAWHALGVACLRDGAPAAAAEALDQACRLMPHRLDIVLLRGEAACAAGDVEGEWARLDELDPHPGTLVARAALLDATGRGDAALDELEAAVAIAPDDPAALAALGSRLARSGKLTEAQAVLRRAVALDAGHQARLDLSTLLMRQRRGWRGGHDPAV